MIEELSGRRLELDRRPGGVGEARRTGCDGRLARQELGFVPRTELRAGLAAQLEWILGRQGRRAVALAGG
jgi:nucleoside-diphosphate-sugar epimerase